jgi:hypothetical protein
MIALSERKALADIGFIPATLHPKANSDSGRNLRKDSSPSSQIEGAMSCTRLVIRPGSHGVSVCACECDGAFAESNATVPWYELSEQTLGTRISMSIGPALR